MNPNVTLEEIDAHRININNAANFIAVNLRDEEGLFDAPEELREIEHKLRVLYVKLENK